MLKKLKSVILDDMVYMAFLIVLVGIGSFGLGRISVAKPSPQTPVLLQQGASLPISTDQTPAKAVSTFGPTPLVLTQPSETSKSADVVPSTGAFVASKAGTKYHALTCPGAKTIKETNKIYFATTDEAEAAGYTRAANCPLR